ncbi:MAG: Rieske 2Fe-2S domain-containing protein [Sporichthyaceae bacterium]
MDGNEEGTSDCVRRSLLRGAVALGAVGVGGALSRAGEGTVDTPALTAAQRPAAGAPADINCACHGAKFSIADGSVKKFPARKPLPAKTVTVEGGKLFVT